MKGWEISALKVITLYKICSFDCLYSVIKKIKKDLIFKKQNIKSLNNLKNFVPKCAPISCTSLGAEYAANDAQSSSVISTLGQTTSFSLLFFCFRVGF